MTINPIVERKYAFFKSARVILNDELFLHLVRDKAYSYIVGLSHQDLSVPLGVKAKHKKTSLINLKHPIDQILARFRDTTRNEVRKTFGMPEMKIVMNDARTGEMHELYRAFRKAKNLEIHYKSFLESATRFSAYYNGELIAVITVYEVPPKMRIQNIFSKIDHEDSEMRKIVGFATRRLMYDICKYGSEHGYESLDLASVNLSDPAKSGITQFKLSFGGDISDEYTYTYRSSIIQILSKLKRHG